jgi:hypothetical protein
VNICNATVSVGMKTKKKANMTNVTVSVGMRTT